MVLNIHEWEIWHTYTTHVFVPTIDLDEIARELVESGIAVCSMMRDGRTYWSSGSNVGSGTTTVFLDPYGSYAKCEMERDVGCKAKLDGFAAEAWYQACYFRFCEQRVLGKDLPLPAPYVRVYLGECNLTSHAHSRSKVHLYPILLVYESGILVLELRTVSPGSTTPLDQFITGAVNLFRHPFDRIEAPPGLVRMATRAYYHSCRTWTLPYRAALFWFERGHDEAVRQLTRSRKSGDFAFDLAPLSKGEDTGELENLSSFALTVFHTVAFLIGRPRLGLAFILRGQKSTPELGDFWSGRPHIHVTRFENQCDTASENERVHAEAFGSILLRVSSPDPAVARRSLPKDARLFEDYSAYINTGASLWVWSKQGLERSRPWNVDANRGHLVYEHQALAELLEYGFMLHRALLERVELYRGTEEVILARRALMKLQLEMSMASHFGEIRELLDYGWQQLGLPQLRSHIQEALSLRETETRESENRLTTRLGQALTILFGVIAVPALGEQVVQPLWELLGIQRPENPAAFTTAANIVSLFGIGFIVALLLRRLRIEGPK